ncbi:hypothetical protein HQQ81_10055 [Microbacteriaceae bacterium VKM Ac-2854]|nr:hypothetical protein [Microbacteriaceae bacterium VKM Ac-2854]
MRRTVAAIALLAVGLLVVGLSGCAGTDQPARPSADVLGQTGMDEVAGSWIPQRPASSPTPGAMECPAGLKLGSDGFWQAVGPYPAAGSWIVADDGAMQVYLPDGYGSGSYPYCEVVSPVVQEITTASSLALDDGVLVLRDTAGAEIGRMDRTSEEGPTPVPMSSESAAPSLPSAFVGEWTADGWDIRLSDTLLVAGTAGCNELNGRWSDFGMPSFFAVRTLRDCDVEQRWITLTTAQLLGDELLVTADDGTGVLLHRTAATG